MTGASSGIGAAFARRLAADGHDLVVVARREDRLRALASSLEDDHGVEVHVVVADLASPSDVEDLASTLARGHGVDLLVNNAGAAGYGPFLDLTPERAEDLIRVHVTATTLLSRAVLPGMVERGAGAVVNVASLLAFGESLPPDPLPHPAVYAGCKAYVVACTQTLHHELAGTGVRVQACCPGIVATEFHDAAGVDRSRSPFPPMQPDNVVTASLEALRLGEVLCLPGLDETALVSDYHRDQRDIFFAANHDRLAARYTATRAPPAQEGRGDGSAPRDR